MFMIHNEIKLQGYNIITVVCRYLVQKGSMAERQSYSVENIVDIIENGEMMEDIEGFEDEFCFNGSDDEVSDLENK